ncbi:hypothetical protein SLEP1_g15772 [Rubroshorea leprosula]|uniref:Poly(A) polymerase nucleotidyltransferase domain-containing protein n=1 Tax=Rubroshorea leprosula TaxID=152421 RepID=A0AAV5INJ5_9ROSI|nr:hypothetical protein SLEP1_g15772 [Rubroshorea leprosula]
MVVGSRTPIGLPPPPPSQSSKNHGITQPISLAGPTDVDIQRNAELEKLLVDSGLYESKEEAAKREEVLGCISLVIIA